MKKSSAAQYLSMCCDSFSSFPSGYRRLYSGIKGPRSEDECVHPSAAEVNCLVLVTEAEVLCWLWGRSWIFRYCLDERHGLEWLSLQKLQLNRIGLYYTECVINTWRFPKFENQRARYAPLPYWPSLYTYNDVWSLVEIERWSVHHQIAAVELFIITGSVTDTLRGFFQEFQRRDAPSLNTLLLWVSKWRQEGSVKDSKPQGRPFSARTPDNVEPVGDAMLRSPRMAARRQGLALRLNEFSVRRILHKDLHYRPYNIQVAQKLSARDKVSRLQFCHEFLVSVKNNKPLAWPCSVRLLPTGLC